MEQPDPYTLETESPDSRIDNLRHSVRQQPHGTGLQKVRRVPMELLALESGAKELGIDMSPEYLATMRWLQAKTLGH